jgi:hypothetical protein
MDLKSEKNKGDRSAETIVRDRDERQGLYILEQGLVPTKVVLQSLLQPSDDFDLCGDDPFIEKLLTLKTGKSIHEIAVIKMSNR